MFTLSISSEDKAVLEGIREFLKEHLYRDTFDSLEFDLTQTFHYPIGKKKDAVEEYCANDVRVTKAVFQSPFEIGDLVVLADNPHGSVYRIVDWTIESEKEAVGLRYMGHGGTEVILTYADPKELLPVPLGRPKYERGSRAFLNGKQRFVEDYRIVYHNAYKKFVHQYMVDEYPGIWWAEQEFDRENKEGKRCI